MAVSVFYSLSWLGCRDLEFADMDFYNFLCDIAFNFLNILNWSFMFSFVAQRPH